MDPGEAGSRDMYGEALSGIYGLDAPVEEYAWSVCHLYAVQVENHDALREVLTHAGIAVAYASFGLGRGSFPSAVYIAARTLSLPCTRNCNDRR